MFCSTFAPRGDGSPLTAQPCARWLAGILFALLTLPGSGLPAQDTLTIPRLDGPIRLDGRVDEPGWLGIPPLALTMFQPTAGLEPSQASEVRLGYDDEFLYASGRFSVAEPSEIRTTTLSRDELGSEDHFLLLLDSFDDNEHAVIFAVNPGGAQTDYAVERDGQTISSSWNGYWDAAVSRDSGAWYAELRIPLSSLRFQVVGDHTVMGLIVQRRIARRNEIATFPSLSPSFANALFRPSIARKIRFTGLRSRAPLYLTPYVLGGVNSVSRFDPTASKFRRQGKSTREAGADAKYGITSNLTLDLSVNTDFAQVEADDEQVNLTRFSLFFPEKRQFFLERGGIFAVNTGGIGDPTLLFHSRRIGLTEDGRPLRIYGGARLVGRVGGWDLGVMSLETARDGGGAENVGVVRLRRRVFSTGSYLGALLTSRISSRGGHNLLYATDAVIRPFGNDYISLQWAQSFDDRHSAPGLQSGMGRIAWERRSSKGIHYNVGAKWTGPGHQPGLGFQPRRDVSYAFGNLRYGWYPGRRTVFETIEPSLVGYLFRRNADHSTESAWVGGYLNFALKSGINGYFFGNRSYESLPQDLPLSSGAVVPAGEYAFDQAGVFLFPGSGTRLRMGFDLTYGRLYDGNQLIAGVSPEWDVSAHLQLGLDYHRNRIRFDSRNQELNADLLRARIRYAVDSHFSVAALFQFTRAAQSVIGNLRVRWHFVEGRDLYLVYNDRLNTDRARFAPTMPELPFSQERTLLIKYAHTFTR